MFLAKEIPNSLYQSMVKNGEILLNICDAYKDKL